MRTLTLTFWRLIRSDLPGSVRSLTARELLLVCVAGLASAVLAQFGGRALHAVWPIPASGSLVAALPRALVLLALLTRVNRFGVLTAVGLAEVAARVAMGGIGPVPWSLTVPILGNLAGDLAWASSGLVRSQRLRAALTGGCLCTARVLAALLFWGVCLTAMQGSLKPVHVLIIGANAVLGVTAGLIVSRATNRSKSHDDDAGE